MSFLTLLVLVLVFDKLNTGWKGLFGHSHCANWPVILFSLVSTVKLVNSILGYFHLYQELGISMSIYIFLLVLASEVNNLKLNIAC